MSQKFVVVAFHTQPVGSATLTSPVAVSKPWLRPDGVSTGAQGAPSCVTAKDSPFTSMAPARDRLLALASRR